jgi:signal transduction histidine kinase
MKKSKILILLEIGLLIAFLLRYLKILPNFEIITFMLVYICTVLNRELYYKKVNLYFLIILVMMLTFGIPKLDWVNLIPFITYGIIVLSINWFSKKKLFLRTFYSVAVFFIISNFLFWIFEPWQMYPKTLIGLILCYAGALPFLKNQLISNLTTSVIFSLVLSRKFFEVEDQKVSETS